MIVAFATSPNLLSSINKSHITKSVNPSDTMPYFLVLLLLAPGDDAGAKSSKPDAAPVVTKAADSKEPAADKKGGDKGDKKDAAATAKSDADKPAEADKKDGEKKEGEDADKAKAEAAKTPSEWEKMMEAGALGYMIRGGIFMWPILILGVLAAGVIVERYRSLKMLTSDSSEVRSQVRKMLNDDRVEDALKLCDNEQGPVPAILSAGLRKFLVLRRLNYDPGRIEEQVVKDMDDYGVHVVAALERHLPVLATVSSVAPMIGFLGTVQGMVVSFADIKVAAKMGQSVIEAAAEGIEVSLLTTCLGLIVGIPAFMAYNYYTSVINRFVLDVEESSSELIETVTLQMTLNSHKSS